MHAVPPPLTSFIGRAAEVTLARALLERTRLLTLTGPGGTGKTRLAIAIAQAVTDAFPDGVVFISLAPLTDPRLVPSTIATALGVPDRADRAPLDSVVISLADLHTLLVLDNFEQVVDAAPIIAAILRGCSAVRILVTSRVPLRLTGEQLLPVPPLELPEHVPPVPKVALEQDAIALFVQRAQAMQPNFQVTPENVTAVIDVCRRLDGLPLAIELAAARITVLTPEAMLGHLTQRLALLTSGARDLPARQRTLRDAIGWSYDLLTPDEQGLFRCLSVFVAGWTLEAAASVCGAEHILDGHARLLDHSLIRQVVQPDGTMRYTMLETIREYGLEQLEQNDETTQARERHARCFLDLVERAEPELRGPELWRWVRTLEDERDNVRAALTWAIEHDARAAMLAASALWFFWNMRAHPTESRRWIEAALAAGDRAPTHARAKALDVAGAAASRRGEFASARTYFEESLRIFRTLGDQWNVANTLRGMCRLALASGDFAWGEVLGTESVGLFAELGDQRNLMIAIGNLGWNALGHGDLERARGRFDQCLTLAHETRNHYYVAHYSGGLAYVSLDQGDHEQASRLFAEILTYYRTMPDLGYIGMCFDGLGRVAAHEGKPERAVRLMGAAHAVREQIGQPAVEAFLSRQLDRDVAILRSHLTDLTFSAAWDQGRRLSLDDAIALALDAEPTTRLENASQSNLTANLSPRERDVLRRVVDGKSDREIAAELFISHHTVMRHVSNILGKLGVESRTAAAAYAIRHRLV